VTWARRLLRTLALAALAFPALASPARAGDITVFVSQGWPRTDWATGYGAALSFTMFQVLGLEGEAQQLNGAFPDSSVMAFTGSAMLAPEIGRFTPYAGVGVGLFRQTERSLSDMGTLRALVLGVKLKLGGLIVLKGEYRKISLSGEPLRGFEQRLSAGAGVAF
jgi:hypothetical protein